MLKIALVLVFLIVGANAAVWDRKQQAGVRGVLLCHGEPARDVLVKMYDADFADGSFEVSGQEAELLTLDVKVNFYHNCDDRIVPCERKFSIGLPSKYVTSGDDSHPLLQPRCTRFPPSSFFVGLCACSAVSIGRKQSAGARGRLMCDQKPSEWSPRQSGKQKSLGSQLAMYDDDRGVDLDDFMGETHTDSEGYFEFSGTSHEFTSIDPKINPCQRKFSIMIPDRQENQSSRQ
ncbi:hypothetical protein M3Y99_01117900 [Aphelenchoides fujianensis]|nr:hypothetical protein M3Y99_01117900 [Aphelenchoides fujianensis]